MKVSELLEKLTSMNQNADIFIDDVRYGFRELETIESFPHYTLIHKIECDGSPWCNCEYKEDGNNYIILNKVKRRKRKE